MANDSGPDDKVAAEGVPSSTGEPTQSAPLSDKDLDGVAGGLTIAGFPVFVKETKAPTVYNIHAWQVIEKP